MKSTGFISFQLPYHKLILFLSIIILILGFQNHASAQEDAEIFTAKNSIYAELGGSSILYGVNYGRILNQKGKFKLSGSAGFSYIQQATNHWTPMIPVELTVLFGKTRHNLEFGAGTTLFTSQQISLNPDSNTLQEKVSFEALIPFRLGYRYQKPEGGFFFRISYTPGFNLNLSSKDAAIFEPIWGGISLGKSF